MEAEKGGSGSAPDAKLIHCGAPTMRQEIVLLG